ncbi:MAG: glycosyltransferase family 4 protein [Candidatus Pacebacteria bacterium]|nr:glycosyltransferase family 4 protein [Candidatus Paceibacterota bacterium]
MRLLVYTQIVDSTDPILGFFHRWIEVLAARVEHITVVCLKTGQHSLPSNVQVLSLGKERGVSRMVYGWRFYAYLWQLRGTYDAVFVHMNQEYVLMGAPLWKLGRTPLYLWRNHYAGSWLTRLASSVCTKVFYTSQSSFTAQFPHAVRMPVGVDLARFSTSQSEARVPRSILMLGRIAPSKRVDVFVEALGLLAKEGKLFTASIYGPVGDAGYYETLEKRIKELQLSQVDLGGAVTHAEAARVFAAHDVFVNLSEPGMYDKTMFEAAASGCTVISANAESPFIYTEPTPEACARAIETSFAAAHEEHVSAAQVNSLDTLGKQLVQEMAL